MESGKSLVYILCDSFKQIYIAYNGCISAFSDITEIRNPQNYYFYIVCGFFCINYIF